MTVSVANLINLIYVHFGTFIYYGNGFTDGMATGSLVSIGGTPTPPTTVAPTVPPDMSSFVSLDSFLLQSGLTGSASVVIGGPIIDSTVIPIANNPAMLFQNASTIAHSALSAIGLQYASFTTSPSLDGKLLGSSAPELTINNGTTTTTYSRSETGGVITDYAVIIALDGTSRRLLYVAGIRDLGTLVAANMLYYVATRFSSTWRFTDTSTRDSWTSAFSGGSAFVIQFTIPSGLNDQDLGTFNNSMFPTPSGVGVFPIPVTIIPIF